MEALLRSPCAMETPHGLLAAREPPILRRGPCAQGEADLHMHGAIGGGGFLLALALGVIRVVCDGFERAGALVFFTSRVLQTHREGPMGTLVGVGHQVCHDKVAPWSPQVLSRPGTEA